ncbi:cephalosporin hydroxylase [bacterium]|nr:MAG: cephalosporin hydroxylase [bacterium]
MKPKQFEDEKRKRIAGYNEKTKGIQIGRQFSVESSFNGYTYNFTWLGLPIIQYPQDIVIMQEIIYQIKPDLIIETGIARGGSMVFYASMLELLGRGKVIGIDIEIREHNLIALKNHPLFKRIELIEGSSIAPEVVQRVKKNVKESNVVLVCLDSKHTHDHVLAELNSYHAFVTKNSYLVVFDTTFETFDDEIVKKLANNYRYTPWGKGSNPRTAIDVFLKDHPEFVIEDHWHKKAMITNCWEGVLRKIL